MYLEGLGIRTGGEVALILAEIEQKPVITLCLDVCCVGYVRKAVVLDMNHLGVALLLIHSLFSDPVVSEYITGVSSNHRVLSREGKVGILSCSPVLI